MGKTVPVDADIRIMEEIVNTIVRTATKNCAILHEVVRKIMEQLKGVHNLKIIRRKYILNFIRDNILWNQKLNWGQFSWIVVFLLIRGDVIS